MFYDIFKYACLLKKKKKVAFYFLCSIANFVLCMVGDIVPTVLKISQCIQTHETISDLLSMQPFLDNKAEIKVLLAENRVR